MPFADYIEPMRAADVVFLAPLVAGLVEVFKYAGVPTRWAGLIAVSFGCLLSFAFHGLTGDALLAGVVVGLTAAGVYSQAKHFIDRAPDEAASH